MTRHDLMIKPEFFNPVAWGIKCFEIRNNDRGFKKGDRVVLHECNDGNPTGRVVAVEISYILTADDFPEGIKDGYCVFGFWVEYTRLEMKE